MGLPFGMRKFNYTPSFISKRNSNDIITIEKFVHLHIALGFTDTKGDKGEGRERFHI